MKRVLALGFWLTLLAGVGGCVKFKQVWTINPDGSGKLTQTFGFSELALEQAPDDPFAGLDDPQDLVSAQDQGWVAFTRPQIKTEGGYKYATYTGYFEDINRVTFVGGGGQGEMQETRYELTDGRLKISQGMLAQVIQSVKEAPEFEDPSSRAFMLQVAGGMEFYESYELPGEAAAKAGYTHKDRRIETKLTIEELLDPDNAKVRDLGGPDVVLGFEPVGWRGGEASWRAELEAAKAEWAAMKEDAAADDGGI